MRYLKALKATAVAVLAIGYAACTRDISGGQIKVEVVLAGDFAGLAQAAEATTPTLDIWVYLLDNRVDLKQLAKVSPDWQAERADAARQVVFTRTEGVYTVAVDVDHNGSIDGFVRDVFNNTAVTVVVSGANPRDDGAFMTLTLDKLAYKPGERIHFQVTGYLPTAEQIHVEVLNTRNGGFIFWRGVTQSAVDEVHFAGSVTIPLEWPPTDPETGSKYSMRVSGTTAFPGVEFVVLPGDNPDVIVGGAPPKNAFVLIAGGAPVVNNRLVDLEFGAQNAYYFKLANDLAALATKSWTGFDNLATANVDWLLKEGADGVRTVYAQFANFLGTVSPVTSDSVLLDSTPPVLSNIVIAPNPASATATLLLTFRSNETLANVIITMDGRDFSNTVCSDLNCQWTYVVQGNESQGLQHLQIEASNLAGLTTRVQVPFEFDFIAPDTFWAAPAAQDALPQAYYTFAFASNDPLATFECRSVGATIFTPCTSPVTVTGLSDGSYTFAVRAIDRAGNVDATPLVAAWQVDTIPPMTLITRYPPSLTNASIVSLEFVANEAATFECWLEDFHHTFAACNSPASYGGLSEGLYTLHIRAKDLAGNIEPISATVNWQIDQTPPQVFALAVTPTIAGAGSTLAITFAVSELGGNNPSVLVDGRAATLMSLVGQVYTFAYTAVGNENETFVRVEASYFDNAGNRGSAVGEVRFDFTPPDTFFAGPLPTPLTTSADAVFLLVANDPFARFECRIDGGAYFNCNANTQFFGLADTLHTFQARAIDSAGNADTTPVSHSWRLDTVPPLTIITGSPASPTSSSLARLDFIATEPAVFRCMIPKLLTQFTLCNSPAFFGGLHEGLYDVYVYATDFAGNIEPVSASASWLVDLSSPSISNLTVNNRYLRAGATATIEFDVSEALPVAPLVTVAGRNASFFALAGSHYTYAYTASGAEPEGLAVVSVRIHDAAFNTDHKTLDQINNAIIFDFTPPDTSGGLYPALSRGEAQPVEVLSSEAVTSPAGVECRIEFEPFLDCPKYIVLGTEIKNYYWIGPILIDGQVTIQYRARDLAGNVDLTPLTVTVQVDFSPPPPPDVSKLRVIANRLGTDDQLEGLAGAVYVTDTVGLLVTGIAGVTIATWLAPGFTIFADGSFTAFSIGDNLANHNGEMYVVAVDQVGNHSAPVTIINLSTDPVVAASLILAQIINNNGKEEYANSGDSILVFWDNSSTGNNQNFITAAVVELAGSGLPPQLMTGTGAAVYFALFNITASPPRETIVTPRVKAISSSGYDSGFVSALLSLPLDNIAPTAPSNVTAWTNGNTLYTDWHNSVSVDVAFHSAVHHTSWPLNYTSAAFAGIRRIDFPGAPYQNFQVAETEPVVPCTDEYVGVFATDLAGNRSPIAVSGPIPIFVPVPELTAWGTVAGGIFQATNINESVTDILIHFDLDSGLPYSGQTTLGTPSPITITVNQPTRISPFELGRDYFVSAQAKVDTCLSDYTSEISLHTLAFVGVGGSISGGGVCEGECNEIGLEGQSIFGGLGFAIASLGDLIDADGITDLLVGAPGNQKAVLMSGFDLTQVTSVDDYVIGQDIFGGGPSLASGLDLNNDGVTDYVVGSPLESTGGFVLAGAVRAYSGVDNTLLWLRYGMATGAQLGYAVATLSDINNDNYNDVVVGAFGCLNASCKGVDGSYMSSGHVYVLSGLTGAILRTHVGPIPGGFYGVAVDAGWDLNNDSVDDYVVGAPGPLVASAVVPRAYVYSGATGNLLQILTNGSDGSDNSRFGAAVAIIRGSPSSVVVGAPSVGLPDFGKVYLFQGLFIGEFGFLFNSATTELKNNFTFGSAVRAIADMNGDGITEFVVGAPNMPFGSIFGGGHAYVFRASDGRLLYQVIGGIFDGAIGYSFADINDRNGDGNAELVVGAPGSIGDGFYGAGRVYLLTTKAP